LGFSRILSKEGVCLNGEKVEIPFWNNVFEAIRMFAAVRTGAIRRASAFAGRTNTEKTALSFSVFSTIRLVFLCLDINKYGE